MKQLNGKAIILWIMALILCVTTCMPAFASTGDRVVFRRETSDDGSYDTYVTGAWKMGNGFCLMIDGRETKLLRYNDIHGEPETFVMDMPDYFTMDFDGTEMPEGIEGLEGLEGIEGAEGLTGAEGTEMPEKAEPSVAPAQESTGTGEEDEDDEDDEEDGFLFTKAGPEKASEEVKEEEEKKDYYNARNWFCWNDELYAMTETRSTPDDDGNTKIVKVSVVHAKLEDGKIILEKSDIPDLDPQYLIETYDDNYETLSYVSRLYTAGNYLVGFVWNEEQKIIIYDLRDGSGREMSVGFEMGIAPGADDFILTTRTIWQGDKIDIKIGKMNLEDQSEEELTEIKGLGESQIGLCYDQEKNALYYLASGQLWVMPELDPEKAEAVNDCAENSATLELLPGGYMLIQSDRTVMVKNTDPSQRGDGITLKVYYTSFDTQAANDAVFEMTSARSDVSVILQQDWYSSVDLLQTMMNRDGQTDIFVMEYEGNAFKAVRKRGYLPDLSDNAQLSGCVERMYPYLQEAAKQDGKLIAVPVSANAGGIQFNMNAWKKLGGTEEELPKTWDEFLDWIMTLPKRLEGAEVKLMSPYTYYAEFRAMIGNAIMTNYQLLMDRKGEDYSFNTPLLKNLLQRVADIDYEALGIPKELKEEDYEELNGYSSSDVLLDTYVFSNGIDGYDQMVPLALSFSKDEDPIIPVTIYAGFVNPYSEHPEEAKEMLALMLKKLNIQAQYLLYTDKTEPIESSYAEETREWHNERMEELEKSLEKAEDENKAQIEEEIREQEKYWEDQERWLWLINQEMIDNYLKCQDKFTVVDYNIFSSLWDAEDKEKARILKGLYGYDMPGQKVDNISLEEALALIDQKVQMKRREGN